MVTRTEIWLLITILVTVIHKNLYCLRVRTVTDVCLMPAACLVYSAQWLRSFYKGRSGIINLSLNHDHALFTHAQ